MAELTPYDWVMQSPGAPIRVAVETAFLDAGARLPRSILNTPSLLVMIALLSSSTAIAAMAREMSDLLSGPEVGARLAPLAVREEIVVQDGRVDVELHLVDGHGRHLHSRGVISAEGSKTRVRGDWQPPRKA